MGLSFTADVAPLGVNRAYAPARWGKRHGFRLTEDGETFKEAIALAASDVIETALAPVFRGPCSVTLRFFWPTEAGDIDGPVKLTLDALQGWTYANDSQVKALHVERQKDAARPRVEIEVASCEPRTEAAPEAKPDPATTSSKAKGSAAADNAHALLFTGKATARDRSLKNARRLKSSVRRYSR